MSFNLRRLLLLLLIIAAPVHGAKLETAAWLVRDRLTTPELVEKSVGAARKVKLDTLIVQVRGRGDAYYQSPLAPRAEALDKAPANFDPLAKIIEKAGGMRVVGWINAFLVWGGGKPPRDHSHVVVSHPDWVLADVDGKPTTEFTAEERARGWLEGPYMDPGSPGYRAHLAAVAGELAANYKLDSLHLDFVRYPGPGYGRGGASAEGFLKATGLDPRWLPEDPASLDFSRWLLDSTPLQDRLLMTGTLLWAVHRADQVEATVEAVREAMVKARPGMRLSAAVFPDAADAFLEKGQDWSSWAEKGLVDELYPMAYFGKADRVKGQLEGARKAAGAVKLWAGLGAYIKEPSETAGEAAQAAKLGYAGVSLFDLGSLQNKHTLEAHYAGLHGLLAESPPPALRRNASLGRLAVLPLWDGLSPAEAVAKVSAREKEFREAMTTLFPRMLARLKKEGVSAPPWREVQGVFRFVHPLDAPEKKAEQEAACQEAAALAANGADFPRLALERSQAATKAFKGDQGRIYLDELDPLTAPLMALKPGMVSGVVKAHNGCWVYKAKAAGDPARTAFDTLPWPARRAVFGRELAKEIGLSGEGLGK